MNKWTKLLFNETTALPYFREENVKTLHIIEDWDIHAVEVNDVERNFRANEESVRPKEAPSNINGVDPVDWIKFVKLTLEKPAT